MHPCKGIISSPCVCFNKVCIHASIFYVVSSVHQAIAAVALVSACLPAGQTTPHAGGQQAAQAPAGIVHSRQCRL